MNDLLSESFCAKARDDIEMGLQIPTMGMESFHKQIQEIENQVDKVAELLKRLKEAKEESKSVTKASAMKVTGTRPDEETIDHLIETGNSEQIFQKAMQDMGRGQVLNTLEEIQERHDAVKEIEKKLLELHQIYLDMAVLVRAQGEILDDIENQVANAVDHIQTGTDALHTAKSLQKKSRKCMMIAIILLLVIALLIVLTVLKPWKKK